MLSRRKGSQRPFPMQLVDEGYVDGVDVRIGEERLIRLAGLRRGVRCHTSRAIGFATGDCDEAPVPRRLNRGQHGSPGDPCRAENPPAEPPVYISTSSWAPPRAIE